MLIVGSLANTCMLSSTTGCSCSSILNSLDWPCTLLFSITKASHFATYPWLSSLPAMCLLEQIRCLQCICHPEFRVSVYLIALRTWFFFSRFFKNVISSQSSQVPWVAAPSAPTHPYCSWHLFNVFFIVRVIAKPGSHFQLGRQCCREAWGCRVGQIEWQVFWAPWYNKAPLGC